LILCGDYSTVELEDGTVYQPRVYKRRFRNGKMFLTGIMATILNIEV